MRRVVFLTVAMLAAGSPAAASAAAPGVFAGSLGVTVPRGADAQVRAINRATGSVAAVREVGRTGRFSVPLPAGSYTVIATIVPRRGKVTQVVSAVTLKSGQRRTKANLKQGRRKKKPKRPKVRAAYVQERGQVTPGSIAIEIPDVTGDLTGEFAAARRGLNDMAVTDLFSAATDECDIAILEVDRRADILKELEFQQSEYVDPATRVTRNFVLGDVEVTGRARQVASDRIEVEYGLRDKRTGADLGTVKGTAGVNDFFEQLEKLSGDLAKELCKLSDTYEVTIDVSGRGNFATHAATGTMQATLKARRASRKAQTWTQTGPIAWTLPVIASKIGCPYIAPIAPTVSWTATLTVAGENQLNVSWSVEGNDATTASIDCPPEGGGSDPPPVAGQPGTALLLTEPMSFVLPFSGGTQPIKGEVSTGGDGFFNTGTIVVKPGPIVRVEG